MKATGKKRGTLTPGVVAVIILFTTLSSGMAEAGVEGEKRLSLNEAVRMALENNHELKALQNSQAARQEDIGIARSNLLPKISLEERYLRTANPTYAFMTKLNQQRIGMTDFAPDSLNHPDGVNDFQTTLSFEQPLFVRKADIGVEMSRKEVEASAEALSRKKEETAFKVVQNYLMVSTASGYAKVAEKALDDAREHKRLAETRYDSGLGLYSDVLRASTAVAEARQKLVSARKNLQVARRALGLVLGSGDPVDVRQEPSTFTPRDMGELRNRSLARRDIKALELKRENAENHIKLAEAGFYPYLGIGGAYQFNDHQQPFGAEGDSWQVMAFLKWDLFDGAKRKYEKTKANHQLSEVNEYLQGMKKLVAFQIEEAWLALDEATVNLALAREELATAEEGRRLVRVRYEGSLSPFVDMLDAQVSLDHAGANLVAKENEYQLAIANLGFASGTIMEDLQLEEFQRGEK